MWQHTHQVCSGWKDPAVVDMLVEMRRIALLIIMDTLFKIDLNPHLDRLWPAILRTLAYISPGPWIVWPGIPRPGYARAINEMDRYFYQVIRSRRENPGQPDDLLAMLVLSTGMSDELIRDQLLTLLIAGHDTSTALLAWALHLLGEHPEVAEKIRQEMDSVLGTGPDASGEPPAIEQFSRLRYLDQVINETLRLYPPIHLGSRIAAMDLDFQGFKIPAGSRVVYSIYLTHRHKKYWPDPARFDPERFSLQQSQGRLPYTFVPFGGGPRNCIGLAFAQVEVKLVLAFILKNFNFCPAPGKPTVRAHMGATLEPHPGVWMEITHRK
jgi:cytochrome P450